MMNHRGFCRACVAYNVESSWFLLCVCVHVAYNVESLWFLLCVFMWLTMINHHGFCCVCVRVAYNDESSWFLSCMCGLLC